MNSIERVMTAITGSPFDKRPFAGVLSLYGAKLTGCPLEKYYTDPQSYIDGQSKVVEMIDPDIITTPLTLIAEGEAFGSQVKYFDAQSPNLKKPVIRDIKDVSKLKMPDIDSSPRLVYTRETMRGLKKKFGNDKAIAGVLLSPLDMPLMIMSMEGWLPAVIDAEEGTKRMLDITVPFFIKWAKTFKDEGADFLVMPTPFTLPGVLTRHIIKQFAMPVFEEAFSKVELPIILHHVGARYLEFLDIIKDLPNVIGFVTDPRESTKAAREKIGDKKVIMSGIDGPNLDKYTPEEVEKHVKNVLEERRNDPHFIFTMTGPDVGYYTPIENILAVRKTIEAFGDGTKSK